MAERNAGRDLGARDDTNDHQDIGRRHFRNRRVFGSGPIPWKVADPPSLCIETVDKNQPGVDNSSMQLSEHFSLKELCRSEVAVRLGIDNTPTDPIIIAKLADVCKYILDPIRAKFGQFTPNSGYRCPQVNAGVGSKPSSQHCKGEAVDFELPSMSNYNLAMWVSDNLDFDQLLLEFAVAGDPHAGWVHCSYIGAGNRMQALTIRKSGTLQGLHA